MKKILFLLVILSFEGLYAQHLGIGIKGFLQNDQSKLSDNFAQRYSFREIEGTSYLVTIAKLSDDFNVKDLEYLNCKIVSKIGNIITLYIPTCRVREVIALEGIIEIDISRKINGAELDRATNDVSSDLVWQGFELPGGYSGKDVIIGVTDWGFDYTHPMFYDTSMTNYRIIGAWDQYRMQGPSPNNFPYGTVFYTQQELLAAQSDTLNIYNIGTHGTHVSGIAAGAGASTPYRGVAFDSELLMATFLIDEAAVLDAYSWMRDVAKQKNKRLVINGSWGLYHFGMMDGTSLLDQAVKLMSDTDSVVFVTSGGNNGDNNFHVKKVFTNNDTISTGITFDFQYPRPNYWGQTITMTGDSTDSFSSRIEFYNNLQELIYATPWVNTASNDIINDTCIVIDGDSLIYRANSLASSLASHRPLADWEIRLSNYQAGKYFVVLSTKASSGIVHAWNVACLNTGVGNWGLNFARFQGNHISGDNLYGVGEPAVGDGMISVAAYTAKPRESYSGGQRAGFSSIGPRIDGALKPEIAAPGVNVKSSISSFATETNTSVQDIYFNDRAYSFASFSGTSMSSPMVAGIVALMLEANPNLTPSQVKTILFQTARQDNYTTSTLPNDKWGWGKVSALDAVKKAVQLIGLTEIENDNSVVLYPNPAKDILNIKTNHKIKSVIISDLLGRNQIISQKNSNEIDISTLNKGVYVVSIGLENKVLRYKLVKN